MTHKNGKHIEIKQRSLKNDRILCSNENTDQMLENSIRKITSFNA